jgi:hypothetical protein
MPPGAVGAAAPEPPVRDRPHAHAPASLSSLPSELLGQIGSLADAADRAALARADRCCFEAVWALAPHKRLCLVNGYGDIRLTHPAFLKRGGQRALLALEELDVQLRALPGLPPPDARGLWRLMLDQQSTLTSLSFRGPGLAFAGPGDARGLRALGAMVRLQALRVESAVLGDAECAGLVACAPRLRRLSLEDVKCDSPHLVPQLGVSLGSHLTHLSILRVGHMDEPADLRPLVERVLAGASPHLLELCIRGAAPLNNADLARLAAACPLLRGLDFSWSRLAAPGLGRLDVSPLTRLEAMTVWWADGCKLSAPEVARIGALSGLRSLAVLNAELGDEAALRAFRAVTGLTALTFLQRAGVGMQPLMESGLRLGPQDVLENLVELCVSSLDCWQPDGDPANPWDEDVDFYNVRRVLPKLTTLRLSRVEAVYDFRGRLDCVPGYLEALGCVPGAYLGQLTRLELSWLCPLPDAVVVGAQRYRDPLKYDGVYGQSLAELLPVLDMCRSLEVLTITMPLFGDGGDGNGCSNDNDAAASASRALLPSLRDFALNQEDSEGDCATVAAALLGNPALARQLTSLSLASRGHTRGSRVDALLALVARFEALEALTLQASPDLPAAALTGLVDQSLPRLARLAVRGASTVMSSADLRALATAAYSSGEGRGCRGRLVAVDLD